MNFSQRLGLFILILITVIYVYASFFSDGIKMPDFRGGESETPEYNPLENQEAVKPQENPAAASKKEVKIYLLNSAGNLSPVTRTCDTDIETSCFEYAIRELISAPTKSEKSKGYTSEIPTGTKVLSVRESKGSILIDLSSAFESGGGAESTYMRVKQIIRTANANSLIPVYLYVNGSQANVIGGEGIMVKQPLNERSLDE